MDQDEGTVLPSRERHNCPESASSEEPSSADDPATRVVISVSRSDTGADTDQGWWVPDADWLQQEVLDDTFKRYLGRAHEGPVSVSDEWNEAVNCGCARPVDVHLRVEQVAGGTTIGEETIFEVVPRVAHRTDERGQSDE